MKKMRGAAAALAGLLLCASVLTGCAPKAHIEDKPKKSYVKWMKVADGEYMPFTMPEYMGTKGLFIQRMGYEEPEEIYHADLKTDKVSLISSGFDYRGELEKAKEQLRARDRDLSGIGTQYLPKRNAILIQVNSPELWLYHIEKGELELLGNGDYTGMPFEQIYNSAFEKWGEQTYLYPYSGVLPSPDEKLLAFGSDLTQAAGQTGQEIWLYDMQDQTEKQLLAGEGPGVDLTAEGWVGDGMLLCVERRAGGETEAGGGMSVFLADPHGRRTELELFGENPPEDMRVYAAGGAVIASSDERGIQAYRVDQAGKTELILDHQLDEGSMRGEPKMNRNGTQLAYLTAPDPYSADRYLQILSVKDGGERKIDAVRIGEGVETSIKNYWWIDSSRLLITVREEWDGQETGSTWVLDLRAEEQAGGEGDGAGENGSAGQNGGTQNAAETAVEIDEARAQDRAKTRDASVMARAYMLILERIYEESPQLNQPVLGSSESGSGGGEGETAGTAGTATEGAVQEEGLRYLALDTTDMLWLTEAQKAELISMAAEKWGVQVLDRTYTQLGQEGYLNEDGYFEDGMVLKITGGYFMNNEMKADALKLRSAHEGASLSGLTLRFENDSWRMKK